MAQKAFIFSSGIRKIPALSAFLPEYQLISTQRQQAEAILGWGLRPSTRKAQAYAQQHQLPYIALEDGFLRSLGLGIQGWAPLSMVVDDVGIYYDTSRPSRLEHLILDSDALSAAVSAHAQAAMQQIVALGLSKYNHAPDFATTKSSNREVVLLIDQTVGDMAIRYGAADETTFQQMFTAALHEHPQANIWVKTHPDVLSGKKQGYLTDLAHHARVRLLAEDINPISLLKQVDKVYCVTSHMGFEALLCGKAVTTFGLPWYAGWGLTDDRHAHIAQLTHQQRRAPRSLTQLFAAAYLQYSRYLNPATGEAGNIDDVIKYLHRARQLNDLLRGDLYCVGVSLWKRAVMKPFFHVPACKLHFVSSLNKLQRLPLTTATSRILAWGNGKDAIIQFANQQQLPILRMEDGFIRSVGLGSNLVPPLSLVLDDMGIYFNPQQPSRLEHILQHTPFTEHDRQAAQQLQHELTTHQISKYNVGDAQFTLPATQKTVLLVIGQVEDDASIRYGSPQIYRNLDLLRTVRQQRPDDYIIYKPHPDVVSGNRVGHIAEEECLRYANQIAAETDILTCLNHAHEVHTMTSLTGFEALLRGKTVYCYGLPFYAGWGLTHDALPIPRRQRRLALWQLIAGTLIYYPHYIHPTNHYLIDATAAIRILQQQKQQMQHNHLHRNWFAKQAGKLKQLYHSLRY